MLATKKGLVKKTGLGEFRLTPAGGSRDHLREDDELVGAALIGESDDCAGQQEGAGDRFKRER